MTNQYRPLKDFAPFKVGERFRDEVGDILEILDCCNCYDWVEVDGVEFETCSPGISVSDGDVVTPLDRDDDTPKLWHDMTDAEKRDVPSSVLNDPRNPLQIPWGEWTATAKGAVLLAQHEGKVIEWSYDFPWKTANDTENGGIPQWDDEHAYRVRPEPSHLPLEAGKTYQTAQQGGYDCIHVCNGYAWLKRHGTDCTAYVWDAETGEARSLGESRNIVALEEV